MPEGSGTPQPRVFISYAHESEQLRASVKALADWLTERGCFVDTDHPYTHRPPAPGWTSWMLACIEEADVVLVVCTPKLNERYGKNAPPETGRGATFEGAIVTQHMYDHAMRNRKFFPIVPDGGRYEDVPTTLRNWWNGHRFPSGYEGILGLIFDQPASRDVQTPSTSAPEKPGSGWSIDKRHEEITARLLGTQGARPFFEALRVELAIEFGLKPAPDKSVAIVQWFSQSSRESEDVLTLFDVVH